MIARKLRSDEEYMQVINGLLHQLQDAEVEVMKLRAEKDGLQSKLIEMTIELNRVIETVVRLQAKQ